MRLVTCSTETGQGGVGVLHDERVLDLQRLLSKQIGLRFTMVDLLKWLGEQAAHLRELQSLVAAAGPADFRALSELQLEAPVPRPGKIVACGALVTRDQGGQYQRPVVAAHPRSG